MCPATMPLLTFSCFSRTAPRLSNRLKIARLLAECCTAAGLARAGIGVSKAAVVPVVAAVVVPVVVAAAVVPVVPVVVAAVDPVVQELQEIRSQEKEAQGHPLKGVQPLYSAHHLVR